MDKFISEAMKIEVGNGLAKTTSMGPLVSETQLNKASYYVRLGVKESQELVLGGEF